MNRKPFSALRPWFAAWVVLVLLTISLRLWAWNRAEDLEAGANGGGWFFKPVLNVLESFTFPGWAVGYLVDMGVDLWKGRVVWLMVVSAMVAWMFWLVIVAAFITAWKTTVRWGIKPARTDAEAAPVAPSRRKFLANVGFGSVGTLAVASAAEATVFEPWRLTLRRYTVPVPHLPRELEGLRIVQISDTHFGPRMPAEFLSQAVEESLALKPDVIALTGDYILTGARYINGATEIFKPLVREGGPVVIGVLGNHDWYGDGPRMSRSLAEIGVAMIDNRRVFLDAATRKLVRDCPASGVCFAGLGDLYNDKIDAKSATGGVPEEMTRVVLAHNPDTAEHPQVKQRVGGRTDLMLSGHTHGGQIAFPIIGAPIHPGRYGQKYIGGLVQGPACPVVISRGVGMQILPVRIGVPPEIVEITLVRKA